MPADFMKVIAEKNYGAAFFVTSRNGKKTEIWPMPEWEIEEAKKAALPEDDAAKNAWMQIVNHFGGVMEIDKQDRVMLTRKVRERFGLINAEVVVRGQGKYLTVQTEQDAEQEIAEMLSPSDSDAKLITIAEARLILAQRESQKQGF